jgi:hypothetical protein
LIRSRQYDRPQDSGLIRRWHTRRAALEDTPVHLPGNASFGR